MDAIRWVLILIAIGAAAAAALWLGLSAPPASPASPSQPMTVVAQPAAPPPATSAASTNTRAVARAASATSSPTPVSARPAAPRIGSEGYGPHIDRAVAGDDAAAAWEAVRWLRLCASNETRRNSLETVRNQGVSPEMMTQMMVEADAEARRCQTVTAQHRVMLPELASRAVRAGVAEAASAFAASTFSGDLTAAQRQQVAEAMRRDALAGDGPSLVNAATSNPAWGLSDAERLSFLMAYAELPDHPEAKGTAKSLLERGALHLAAPPTPQQMAAAREAAQQILARRPAGGKP